MASCCSDRLNKWKKRCPTAANQLRNVCRRKHRYFCHYEVNTWTCMFFSFSQNTNKKLVPRSKLGHYCAKIGHSQSKHWPKTLCHPRNSWLSNKDITLNLHTADQNLFNNGHFSYNYEWKCKNNVVLMKSNNLICQTQHHISIETKKVHDRNRKFTHRSLLAPCWKRK